MSDFEFVLKKFITFFVEPYGIVFSLFFIGLYFLFLNKYTQAKRSLFISFTLLFLFAYPPFANFLISNLENQYPKYSLTNKVKYIHVLGSGHNDDDSQPLSSQISSASIKRDLEGILIHKTMPKTKIIFTGYAGNTSISNAKINKKLALSLGINKNNLIINSKPKDTKEEALFSKTIVGKEPFILVTSATHMPRSMMLFESLGLHPIPAPTNFYKKKIDTYFDAPDIESFMKSQIAVHEYIGILWTKLKNDFK